MPPEAMCPRRNEGCPLKPPASTQPFGAETGSRLICNQRTPLSNRISSVPSPVKSCSLKMKAADVGLGNGELSEERLACADASPLTNRKLRNKHVSKNTLLTAASSSHEQTRPLIIFALRIRRASVKCHIDELNYPTFGRKIGFSLGSKNGRLFIIHKRIESSGIHLRITHRWMSEIKWFGWGTCQHSHQHLFRFCDFGDRARMLGIVSFDTGKMIGK